MTKRIVIVGGGAAGFFSAIRVADKALQDQNPVKISILESSRLALKKVRISGGGRCNVTHHRFDVNEFCQNYPRGAKELISPMQIFQAKDTVNWFEQRGVSVVAEADGRMFPKTNRSETIISCFQDELTRLGVELLTGYAVESIEKLPAGDFLLQIKGKGDLKADKVLLATGSSSSGYEFVSHLGHQITERAPSLFSFQIKSPLIAGLEGLSFKNCKVKLTIPGKKVFRQHGPCLITHWGLSGPAILKLSAWAAREMKRCDYTAKLSVNWLGLLNLDDAQDILNKVRAEKPNRLLRNISPTGIPKRFWAQMLDCCGVSGEKKWSDMTKKDVTKLKECLLNSQLDIIGKNRFKDEFVECGGVGLKEVNFKSMESKICPGLYLAGELLDVDGVTGGFNFQNAWTTAWIAGSHMAESLVD